MNPAGMDCAQFLHLYSDYRDGRLSNPATRDLLERHLADCGRCLRYHAAVSCGVRLLRSLGGVEPSPRFRPQLHRKLGGTSLPGPAMMPGAAGVFAALLLVAAASLFVWEGLAHTPGARATAESSAPIIVANPSVPFVSFTSMEQAAPTVPSTDLEVDAESLARWTTAP